MILAILVWTHHTMTLYFCNSVVVSAHTYCFPSVQSSKPLQRHESKQALKIVVWHCSFSIILLYQLDASFVKTKHFTDMQDDQKKARCTGQMQTKQVRPLGGGVSWRCGSAIYCSHTICYAYFIHTRLPSKLI